MATSALDILIRARDEASGVIRGVGSEAQRLDANMGSVSTKTSKLGGFFQSAAGKLTTLVGGAFAAKQVFDFGADLVHSAEEAKAATRAAFGAIRSDADRSDISLKGLAASAESFGNSIGQDDEAILGLSARLTQMVNLTKLFGSGGAADGLDMMTKAVYDMSAATGKSTSMITRLFASIANDPGAAVGTLQKLGVITEHQADVYKRMADHGKDAAVSQELLGLVSQKYEGQAARSATVSEKLGAIWDNFKETLGGFLLPLFNKLVGFVSNAVQGFQNLVNGGGHLSGIFGDIAKTWGKTLGPALSDFWKALQQLWQAVQPIVKVLLAVVGAALVLALKALPYVIRAVIQVETVLAKLYTVVIDKVVAVFRMVAPIARSVWQTVSGVVVDAWHKVQGAWNGAKAFFTGIWDGVKGAASAAFNGIRTLWNSTVGGFGFSIPSWVPFVGGKEFRIPYLATGGIVDSPTLAMIGEAGPEAVIPLRRAGEFGLNGRQHISVGVNIDRRRWVNEHDYEITYGGV